MIISPQAQFPLSLSWWVSSIIHCWNYPLPSLMCWPCLFLIFWLYFSYFTKCPRLFGSAFHYVSAHLIYYPKFLFFLFFLHRRSYWGLLKLQLLRYVKYHLSIWKPHISLIQLTQYNILNFLIKVFIKLRKISTFDIYRKEGNEKKNEVNVNFQFLEFCNCHNFSSRQYWDSYWAKTRCTIKLQLTQFCLWIWWMNSWEIICVL